MGSGNVKKFELKLERTGVIIVVVGMTILLCLSFLLGVGVGKNIDAYPGKISSFPQRVLALFWRPAKMAGEQKITETKEVQPDKSNMDLAFHKALTSEKLPSMQPAPPPEVRTETPPPVEAVKEDDIAKKVETPEPKVEAKEKSSAESKSKTKDAPAPVTAGSAYLIHVTSLKDKVKAFQINKTIVSMGYPAKIVKVDLKGKGTWYRVIVPGFENKAKAQAASDRISKKVKVSCAIWPVGGTTGKKP